MKKNKTSPHFFRAYWLPRKHTFRESVHIVLKFVKILERHKPQFFSDLYVVGLYRGEESFAKKKLSYDYDTVKEYLFDSKGDEDAYQEFGYSTALWNGRDNAEAMRLHISSGSPPTSYSPSCYGSFEIDFPRTGKMCTYYQDPGKQLALLHLMIEYWKPNFLRVNATNVYKVFNDNRLLEAINVNNTPQQQQLPAPSYLRKRCNCSYSSQRILMERDINNERELRREVLLTFQSAVLGKITPNLRAITADWGPGWIKGLFIYDGPVTDIEMDAISEIEGEMLAVFFPDYKIDLEAKRKDAPSNSNQAYLRAWIYHRREY